VAELLEVFEAEIDVITLRPSSGGVFEISLDEALVYSKKATHRHLEKGEGIELVRKYLEEKR
jgi:selenoprotein W-related protein